MCANRQALRLLQRVHPHLSRLRAAAKLGIAFQAQRVSTGRPSTDAYRARQEQFWRQMRRLTAAQWRQDGEHNGAALLSGADVLAIRRRLATGESGVELAKQYGVAASTVAMAATGKSWKVAPQGHRP